MSADWSEAKTAIARLVAPLGIWMAAGWASYPYAMDFIVSRTGDEVDIGEIRSFSIAAAAACVTASVIAEPRAEALPVLRRGEPSRGRDVRALRQAAGSVKCVQATRHRATGI